MKCSDIIGKKYEEFYKSLPQMQFDKIHKFVRVRFSVFGTIYWCEKTFKKAYAKNVYRSILTVEHLNLYL